MKEEPAYLHASAEELTTAHAIFCRGRFIGATEFRRLNNKNLSKKEREVGLRKAYDEASLRITKKNYDELSPATRSEIWHLNSLASEFRFRTQDTLGPSLWEEIEAETKEENRQAVFEDWSRALLKNKNLRDMLHPEDDQAIIDDLPRFLAEEKALEPVEEKHR